MFFAKNANQTRNDNGRKHRKVEKKIFVRFVQYICLSLFVEFSQFSNCLLFFSTSGIGWHSESSEYEPIAIIWAIHSTVMIKIHNQQPQPPQQPTILHVSQISIDNLNYLNILTLEWLSFHIWFSQFAIMHVLT